MLQLTPHQERLIKMRLAGLSLYEVSKKVGTTEGTIQNTYHSIYMKLGISFDCKFPRKERLIQLAEAYERYQKYNKKG